MIDPILGLGALTVALLLLPAKPNLDPGPHAECPSNMRLVEGTHYDDEQHLCLDSRPSGKDTHCFAYHEGLTAEEGKATPIRVCMDQFEAPNVRGARPYVMRSFNDAKKWCGDRGKRVCAEQEWELACEGPEHRPLAYGWRVDTAMCNSDKQWRQFDVAKLYSTTEKDAEEELEKLWQGSPSGAYSTCASSFGIFDMMGNVEEWVASRSHRTHAGSLMGGFWAKPWTGCRGTNDAHEATFVFYETGFRCCSEPGALPTAGKRKKKKKG